MVDEGPPKSISREDSWSLDRDESGVKSSGERDVDGVLKEYVEEAR